MWSDLSHPPIRHASWATALGGLVLSGVLSAQTLFSPGGTVGSSSNSNVGIGTQYPQGVLDLGNGTGGRALTWGGPSGNGRYASIFTPYSAGGLVLAAGFHGDDASDSYVSSYGGSSMGRSAIRLNVFGGPAGAVQFFTDSPSSISAGSSFVPTERMRITATGNIGIGTTGPDEKLSVAGNISIGGGYLALRDTIGGTAFALLQAVDTDLSFMVFGSNGWLDAMRVDGDSGNVGIGTTTPTHKLAVNGTIRAKEIIVDTGWADYVFASDYRLTPLDEVEAHISDKGHLPGMPSAAVVAENGVSLGRMQSLLLAKIEELTLHVIAQEKEIKLLKMQNNEGARRKEP